MRLTKERIKNIRKQDRKTELNLYKECFSFWMGVAFKYYRNEDEASIVVNDSFIKLCNNIKKYDINRNFLTWSKTILIRVILDDLRKNKKYNSIILKSDKLEENFNIMDEEILVLSNSIKLRLKKAIKKLPKATKNIFELFFFDGLDHEEISDYLGISMETSKWHIKNGKEKLRSNFKNEMK